MKSHLEKRNNVDASYFNLLTGNNNSLISQRFDIVHKSGSVPVERHALSARALKPCDGINQLVNNGRPHCTQREKLSEYLHQGRGTPQLGIR